MGNSTTFKPGHKKVGGRKKGTKSRRQREREFLIATAGLSPKDFMLQIMHDPKLPLVTKLEAAKAVANYVHPKLMHQTVKNEDPPPPPVVNIVFEEKPEDESAED